ncbi:MAG TPA: hypothetical protein VF950_18125 [Planctomycetota bacterium]
MAPHPLRGYARWLVFPAMSAAGGALAFAVGKAPFEWTWRLGAVLGLAPGLACAIHPRLGVDGLLALALTVVGAFAIACGTQPTASASDLLRELFRPEAPNLVLAAATLVPALFQGFRLREGPSWWWMNLAFQGLATPAIPAVMWWYNVPIETGSFTPFVILVVGHVAAIETASFLSPRVE